PVLVDYEMLPGIRLTYNAFLACNEVIDGVHTVIMHAANGARSRLAINADMDIRYTDEATILHTYNDDHRTIEFDLYHFAETQKLELTIGEHRLRLLVLDTDA